MKRHLCIHLCNVYIANEKYVYINITNSILVTTCNLHAYATHVYLRLSPVSVALPRGPPGAVGVAARVP